MSAPWSGPNRAASDGLWSRHAPVWSCSTSPSSTLMDAISSSIWPRKSSVSPGRGSSPSTRAKRSSASRAPRSAVADDGCPWSEAVAPAAMNSCAPEADAVEVSLPGRRVGVREPAQCGDVRAKAATVRVDDVVRPEGGHDRAAPAGASQSGVRLERAEGTVGRRQELNTRPLEHGSGPELVPPQAGAHVVVDRVRRLGPQGYVDAQHLCQRVLQPELRRRAPEQMEVIGECTPDEPAVALRVAPVERPDAERLEGDPLAVQHAQQVMVPRHQLGGRVAEPDVVGELCRVAVTVRAHDGQRPRPLVDAPGDLPGARISGQESIVVQHGAMQSFAQTGRMCHTCRGDTRIDRLCARYRVTS